MAQLIQLRQRIKAIDTIKKITHAMRLIAMSSHSRLRNKEEALKHYMQASTNLLATIKPFIIPQENTQSSITSKNDFHLIIIVGSQRGLCGSFNTMLIRYFNEQLAQTPALQTIKVIIVGKQLAKDLKANDRYSILRIYDELSNATIGTIAQETIDSIEKEGPNHISMISNHLKNFFVQKPHMVTIFPMVASDHQEPSSSYLWDEQPETLWDRLIYQTLKAHIHYLLFESLLAEQAARFLSMDNATRNAQNLLQEAHLQYNKLRQAKITKEITELSGSF